MGYGLLRKRIGCILLAGLLMLGASGCGNSDEAENGESGEIVLTGEMVPVANFQEVKFDLSSLNQYEWQDDHLIYLESVWNKERNMSEGTLYQVNLDGTGAPEALYTGISEDHSIMEFTLGQDGSFFTLESKQEEGGKDTYFLRKLDSDLQELYRKEITDKDFVQCAQNFSFADMFADSSGNLLLTGYNGQGYFFDKEGRYTGCDALETSQGQIVDAGEKGIFFACRDWDAGEMYRYRFQKIDLAKGMVGEEERRDLSVVQTSRVENGTVLSGYDAGILISTENGLWSYDYDADECVKLLDWQRLGVNGYILSEIRLLHKDFPLENLGGYTEQPAASVEEAVSGEIPETSPVLEALSYNITITGGQNPEIVQVGYLDKGYIPEKKTVTLGMAYTSSMRIGQLVRSFNRSNMEYEVIVKDYDDMDAFTNDLLFNQAEVPDMLELGWINKDMLESKGLLEDLRPYMEESDVVGESDIMEAVWEACESHGKLTSMMTGFSVQSLATTADTVPVDGWTYDRLFELGRDNPDSKLLNIYSPVSIWNLLSCTMDSYIDWENGTCHFDSPEFMQLLENVKGLSYPENQEEQRIFYSNEEDEKFLRKEYLLQYNYYYSPYDYNRQYARYGDKAWDVGFPTQDGELCYLINPVLQFAVCSNSSNKDASWAFLEFVLSEEEQSWYGSELGGFPVRKDAFETYLEKPYNPVYRMEDDVTSDKTIEQIRKVMEHLRLEGSTDSGEFDRIIYEETQAFFAGDKTVAQCVEIIQNRAQLYLDENF